MSRDLNPILRAKVQELQFLENEIRWKEPSYIYQSVLKCINYTQAFALAATGVFHEFKLCNSFDTDGEGIILNFASTGSDSSTITVDFNTCVVSYSPAYGESYSEYFEDIDDYANALHAVFSDITVDDFNQLHNLVDYASSLFVSAEVTIVGGESYSVKDVGTGQRLCISSVTTDGKESFGVSIEDVSYEGLTFDRAIVRIIELSHQILIKDFSSVTASMFAFQTVVANGLNKSVVDATDYKYDVNDNEIKITGTFTFNLRVTAGTCIRALINILHYFSENVIQSFIAVGKPADSSDSDRLLYSEYEDPEVFYNVADLITEQTGIPYEDRYQLTVPKEVTYTVDGIAVVFSNTRAYELNDSSLPVDAFYVRTVGATTDTSASRYAISDLAIAQAVHLIQGIVKKSLVAGLPNSVLTDDVDYEEFFDLANKISEVTDLSYEENTMRLSGKEVVFPLKQLGLTSDVLYFSVDAEGLYSVRATGFSGSVKYEAGNSAVEEAVTYVNELIAKKQNTTTTKPINTAGVNTNAITSCHIVALRPEGTTDVAGFRFKTNIGSYDIDLKRARELGITNMRVEKYIVVRSVNGLLMSESEVKNRRCITDVSYDEELSLTLYNLLFDLN